MSISRTNARLELGIRTGQPFFRKWGKSAGTGSASGTTTTLIDTARLLEEDDYWNGSFIYFPSTNELREISDFDQGTSTVTWLGALASATGNTTGYEIWSTFTPIEVHAALDNALQEAWPFFFDVSSNEEMCVEDEHGLLYTLPTTDTIKRLLQVYLMYYESDYSGAVTTKGTTTQVIDSSAAFTSADEVGRWVCVYRDGDTANGDVRQIDSVTDANTLVVSSAFTEALPVGTDYIIVNKESTSNDQVLLQNWIVDVADNPTKLWLSDHPSGCEGYLFRLVYEKEYSSLSAEASTTNAPLEYLYHKSMAYLYALKLASAPAVEQPVWESLWKLEERKMEQYIKSRAFRHLPATVTDHNAHHFGLPSDYPFKGR